MHVQRAPHVSESVGCLGDRAQRVEGGGLWPVTTQQLLIWYDKTLLLLHAASGGGGNGGNGAIAREMGPGTAGVAVLQQPPVVSPQKSASQFLRSKTGSFVS